MNLLEALNGYFKLPPMKSHRKNKMGKTKTHRIEYPIVLQAQDNDIYDKAVEYINKIARQNSDHREKSRINYYLEGDIMREKIRTTPSKRTIELTSTIDEEIITTLRNILGVK